LGVIPFWVRVSPIAAIEVGNAYDCERTSGGGAANASNWFLRREGSSGPIARRERTPLATDELTYSSAAVSVVCGPSRPSARYE